MHFFLLFSYLHFATEQRIHKLNLLNARRTGDILICIRNKCVAMECRMEKVVECRYITIRVQRDTIRHKKDDGIIMCRSHPEQIQITKIVIYIYQQTKQYYLKISLTNKHTHTMYFACGEETIETC